MGKLIILYVNLELSVKFDFALSFQYGDRISLASLLYYSSVFFPCFFFLIFSDIYAPLLLKHLPLNLNYD